MPAAHRPGLRVDSGLTIPESELSWRFSRSSGPGGQGVNTADSRAELVWDVAGSASLSAPAGATPRASEQSPCRRSTDDHSIRAPRAIAQQGCCARSARRRRGRRSAAAVTVATTDESESRCQGTALGSEEAAHRRQATASPTSRLTTEVALLDGRTPSTPSAAHDLARRRLRLRGEAGSDTHR